MHFNDTQTFITHNVELVSKVCQEEFSRMGNFLPLFDLSSINKNNNILVEFFKLSSYLTSSYTARFSPSKDCIRKAFKAFFLLSAQDLFIAYVVPLSHLDLVRIVGLKKCLILALSNSSQLVISPEDYAHVTKTE